MDALPLDNRIALRTKCVKCGWAEGYVDERNGQACVFCAHCGRHQYNAPKKERGLIPLSVRSADGISPSLRFKIMERARFRCEFCGRDPNTSTFHIGHLLSVKDLQSANLPEWLHRDPDNLAWLCAECNLGMGERSLALHDLLILTMKRQAEDKQRGG